MRKFSLSNLLILVLMVTLCACSGNDDRNGDDGEIVRYWGAAELIESNDTGGTNYPQIAMNPDGTAMAVWRQFDGARNNIWANRFDGGTWGTPELIESNDTGDADYPQIAMAPDGTAIAVWHQWDGARNNIWANRFDGNTWGTAELIENNAGTAYYPQVAMDTYGRAIAVWHQYDGTQFSIWANRFEGGTWGTADRIESNDTGDAYFPQIAMAPDGTAMAVWQQSDGTRNNIWANRFDGTWGAAELIESGNAGNANEPQIAMNPDGTAVAVWHQYGGTWFSIWANRFDGATWDTAELIESDDNGNAFTPQVAMDPDGTVIAVWRQYDGIRESIWANRFDSSTWGEAGPIESDDIGFAYDPQVAMDASGRAIAIWHQSDGTRTNIWTNRFDGVAWGTVELIESDDTGNAFDAQIAMNADGDAIAVWNQSDGTRTNIWSNRYE